MKIPLKHFAAFTRIILVRSVNAHGSNTWPSISGWDGIQMFDKIMSLLQDPVAMEVKEDDLPIQKLKMEAAYAELSILQDQLKTGYHKDVLRRYVDNRMQELLTEIEKLK
jgi:hypothetical protein